MSLKPKTHSEGDSPDDIVEEPFVDTQVDAHGQTDPAIPTVLQEHEDMGQEEYVWLQLVNSKCSDIYMIYG